MRFFCSPIFLYCLIQISLFSFDFFLLQFWKCYMSNFESSHPKSMVRKVQTRGAIVCIFQWRPYFLSLAFLIILCELSMNFWNNDALIRRKLTSWDGLQYEILLLCHILVFSPLNKWICNHFFLVYFVKKFMSHFESSHPE